MLDKIVPVRTFPDHHVFTVLDAMTLVSHFQKTDPEGTWIAVTTEDGLAMVTDLSDFAEDEEVTFI